MKLSRPGTFCMNFFIAYTVTCKKNAMLSVEETDVTAVMTGSVNDFYLRAITKIKGHPLAAFEYLILFEDRKIISCEIHPYTFTVSI